MRTSALRAPDFEQLYCSAEIVVLIRGTHYNLDLERLYVDLYGMPRDGARIRFVLANGAEIRSRRTDLAACMTGSWQCLSH